jgi:Holliday junction resolvasome RuvABC endonuclease subunit
MRKIAGIDASLTNTGLYFGPGDYAAIPTKGLKGSERLEHIWWHVHSALVEREITDVIIEGYAFAANARHHRIGEGGGAVRIAAVQAGAVAIWEVPPTSLKKWFTGKGAASKDDMMSEAARRLGAPLPCHDIADAYALWLAGHDEEFLKDKGTRG